MRRELELAVLLGDALLLLVGDSLDDDLVLLFFPLRDLEPDRVYSQRSLLARQRSQPSFSPLHFNYSHLVSLPGSSP